MTVKDLLARELVWVDADSPVHEIAAKMRSEDVGIIPVISNGHAVGVITDRDLVLRVLAPISEPEVMTAWDVMTRDPISVDEDAPLERALELMRTNRIHRLLVLQRDGAPLGVISLSDISRHTDKAGEVLRVLASKPSVARYPRPQVPNWSTYTV